MSNFVQRWVCFVGIDRMARHGARRCAGSTALTAGVALRLSGVAAPGVLGTRCVPAIGLAIYTAAGSR